MHENIMFSVKKSTKTYFIKSFWCLHCTNLIQREINNGENCENLLIILQQKPSFSMLHEIY